jgi:hypothetical protein
MEQNIIRSQKGRKDSQIVIFNGTLVQKNNGMIPREEIKINDFTPNILLTKE